VISVDEDGALIRASADDPTQVDVYLAVAADRCNGQDGGAGNRRDPASGGSGVHAVVLAGSRC
jgi:hypothetical protein